METVRSKESLSLFSDRTNTTPLYQTRAFGRSASTNSAIEHPIQEEGGRTTKRKRSNYLALYGASELAELMADLVFSAADSHTTRLEY